mgnify:CR=1 FL=1
MYCMQEYIQQQIEKCELNNLSTSTSIDTRIYDAFQSSDIVFFSSGVRIEALLNSSISFSTLVIPRESFTAFMVLDKIRNDGLDAALYKVINGTNQEFVID